MKNKILIGIMAMALVALVALVFVDVHAQSTPIPNPIADAGVQDAKNHMDEDVSSIASDNSDAQNHQADLTSRQQAIFSLATMAQPLPSAVALCVSNPTQYCPGYPPAPVCGATGSTCSQNSDCCSNVCNGEGINWESGTCQ